jgi:hypothetical protein
MLSGRRLDLLDPAPLDIEIEDIAHGLAFRGALERADTGRPSLFGGRAFAAGRDDLWPLDPGAAAKWRLAALCTMRPNM